MKLILSMLFAIPVPGIVAHPTQAVAASVLDSKVFAADTEPKGKLKS